MASGIARCCVVEHRHEAGLPAARADVAAALRRVRADEQHRRRGDQPAAHLVDVADVLAHRPLHRRLVELAQLLHAAEGAIEGVARRHAVDYARAPGPACAGTRGRRRARPGPRGHEAHAGRPESSPLSARAAGVDPAAPPRPRRASSAPARCPAGRTRRGLASGRSWASSSSAGAAGAGAAAAGFGLERFLRSRATAAIGSGLRSSAISACAVTQTGVWLLVAE